MCTRHACGSQRRTLWSWLSLSPSRGSRYHTVWLARLRHFPSGHFLHVSASLPPCFLVSKMAAMRCWSPPPLVVTQAMHLADGTGGEAALLGTGHGRLAVLIGIAGRENG